ncbi:hypothetical protein D5086_012054 [Populus alba]|uniref:Uncharacterized protein n=1 Tax=Populus alba TaxID=43335 RepID=A0ACC4C1S6_POPAL
MEVQILSRKLIAPSSPTPPHLQNLKVSCFDQFLEREEREQSEMASHLVAPLFQAESSPLVMVQFNMFECGGLAIGISIAHRIADAFTIGTFISAWATACRIGSDKVHCRPSFQLGSLFPPKQMPSSSTGTAPGTDIKIIRRRFVFDGHT